MSTWDDIQERNGLDRRYELAAVLVLKAKRDGYTVGFSAVGDLLVARAASLPPVSMDLCRQLNALHAAVIAVLTVEKARKDTKR